MSELELQVPQGLVDKYYNPKNFTPALPQQNVLDESISPIAWVPFWTQNPYKPLPDNQTRELRRHCEDIDSPFTRNLHI